MNDELEIIDMVSLIKAADLLNWDEDRLLRACHNLLMLDDSLDAIYDPIDAPIPKVKGRLTVVRD